MLTPALRLLSFAISIAGILLAPGASSASSQDARIVSELIAARETRDTEVATQIWQWAEVGYQEKQSSELLQAQLREAGFNVQAGVAAMPTAFVASAGAGEPVIGILAEFDALPGFSQAASPERSPAEGSVSGHACGHHLFGVGSISAAISIKEWLARSRISGTIRLYGTPAEEGGAGKVYMVRAGLFDDVDVVLHWHPADINDASPVSSQANRSAKFRFFGEPSHAAASPERGRSALDGVEAMDNMVNLMREHVPQETRIHYVITRGGAAPNVVPEFAEVYYYVRHPDPLVLDGIWARVVKASEGAAVGTDTRVEHEVIHGVYSLLSNDTVSRVFDRELRAIGGVHYTAAEQAFAEKLHATLPQPARALGTQAEIQPYAPRLEFGSTDVGDVSWVVPTAGPQIATWVPGTPAHSWQAVAAGGMSIGFKGMQLAAQTLARTAVALYRDPRLVQEARKEFESRRGPDFRYRPLIGDRAPPLDYRN